MDLSEPLKNQGPCPKELRNLTAENFVSPDKHARGKLSELKAPNYTKNFRVDVTHPRYEAP